MPKPGSKRGPIGEERFRDVEKWGKVELKANWGTENSAFSCDSQRKIIKRITKSREIGRAGIMSDCFSKGSICSATGG